MSLTPDELLAQVRETAEGFEVFGELGRRSDTDLWYLARDRAAGTLVALRLKQDRVENGEPIFGLEVARELDHAVALGEGRCPSCRARLKDFARFCSRCGFDLAGGGRMPKTAEERAALLAEVRTAAAEHFDVLGQMPWSGGVGVVYFAIERATGRLTRLRLRDDQGDLSLDETEAVMPLKTRMSATYTAPAGPVIQISKVIKAAEPGPAPLKVRITPLPSAAPAPPAPPRPPSAPRPNRTGWILAAVAVVIVVVLVLLKAF